MNTKDNVLNYDNLSYSSNLNSLKKVSSSTRYNFVRGDINDRNNLLSVLNDYQPDFIINFAAETHVDRSISDPKNFIDTNICGTFNLIVCANEYWQKLPKNKKTFLDFTKFQLMKFMGLSSEGYFSENSCYMPHSLFSIKSIFRSYCKVLV